MLIKKSFIIFIISAIVYALGAHYLQWPSKSLSQWEDNERLVSKFLKIKEKNKLKTIIVGSSMAFRMTINENPYQDNVYNLSLGGQSIFEGLEILKRSRHIPEFLFIETNVIYRKERKDYAQSFFIPGIADLKKHVKGLRYEYRPVTLAQYLFSGLKNKFNQVEVEKKIDKNVSLLKKDKKTDTQKEKKINPNLLEKFDDILKNTEWDEVIIKLNDYVRYFQNKGVKVIFFEMPTSKFALESPLYGNIRNLFKIEFKNEIYLKASPERTTDGVHLKPVIAEKYLDSLLKK